MAHPPAKFDHIEREGAMRAALNALELAGFVVGPEVPSAPRGVMFGGSAPRGWHALSPAQQRDLHGQVWGGRGHATIMLHADAPAAATKAFFALLAAEKARQGIEA